MIHWLGIQEVVFNCFISGHSTVEFDSFNCFISGHSTVEFDSPLYQKIILQVEAYFKYAESTQDHTCQRSTEGEWYARYEPEGADPLSDVIVSNQLRHYGRLDAQNATWKQAIHLLV